MSAPVVSVPFGSAALGGRTLAEAGGVSRTFLPAWPILSKERIARDRPGLLGLSTRPKPTSSRFSVNRAAGQERVLVWLPEELPVEAGDH